MSLILCFGSLIATTKHCQYATSRASTSGKYCIFSLSDVYSLFPSVVCQPSITNCSFLALTLTHWLVVFPKMDNLLCVEGVMIMTIHHHHIKFPSCRESSHCFVTILTGPANESLKKSLLNIIFEVFYHVWTTKEPRTTFK